MHLQPVYRGCRVVGGEVAADLFARGLCLPSGSTLSDEAQQRVVDAFLRNAWAARLTRPCLQSRAPSLPSSPSEIRYFLNAVSSE